MIFLSGNRVSVIERVAAGMIVSAMCLVLSGCGNGLATVSGQVTLDGQPLHGGNGDTRVTVLFAPANGVGPNAAALADENGNYTVSTGSRMGIPPGEYVVTCSASELVRNGPNKEAGARLITDPKDGSPKTSKLRFTVQSGRNEFNIPLQSPPKTAAKPGA